MTLRAVIIRVGLLFAVVGAVALDVGAFFPPSPVFDVVAFGADATGVADSTTAVQAAFTAAGVSGGLVNVPCGTYKITTAISATIPNNKKITLQGGGADCSLLAFSGAINGVTLTYGGIWSGADVKDIAFSTDQIGSTSATPVALTLTQTIDNGDGGYSAQSTIQNVVFRGANLYGGAQTQYWGIGINGFNVNNVNITNFFFDGLASKGDAIVINGDNANANYAVIWNISHSTINECNVGVSYGNYVQGVTITGGTNIVGCEYGTYGATIGTGAPAQLTVSDSQFNDYVCAICINDNTFDFLKVSNSIFLLQSGAIGVQVQGFNWSINNNVFYQITGTGGIGVAVVAGQFTGGIASENTFYYGAAGFSVSATATNAQARFINNKFVNVTGNYVINSAARYVYIDDDNPQNYASLPSCTASITDSRAYVLDSNTTTYNATVAGGGTSFVVALCDGTAWRAH